MRLAVLIPLLVASTLSAQTLSRNVKVEPLRDFPSRNLKGIQVSSDGRVSAGPFLHELKGDDLPPLLWRLAPGKEGKWLLGTGPTGKILEVSIDAKRKSFDARELGTIPASHVFAVHQLPDGSVLAGTSPYAGLFLIKDKKVVSRAHLAGESVHDFAADPHDLTVVYVATGNPGRIYKLDTKKFSRAGIETNPLKDEKAHESRGLTLFGEARDRHLRRLAWLEGKLVAGSSPKGNVYQFPEAGGDPMLLLENKDSEVTDLVADGDALLVALTHSAPETESRINISGQRGESAAAPSPNQNPAPSPTPTPTPQPPARSAANAFDRFAGRSSIVRVTPRSATETLAARANLALYAMAKQGNLLILGGGEQGDLVGYDLARRTGITFAGSSSAQLNQLAPLSAPQGSLLVLRNNPSGLSILRWDGEEARSAETKRIDLTSLGKLGAFRPDRIQNLDTGASRVEVRGTRTSDEAEGWGPWIDAPWREDGWAPSDLYARFVKYRLTFPAKDTFTFDSPEVYLLPENRRPTLGDFRILPPDFEVRPPAESAPSLTTTVGSLSSGDRSTEGRNRNASINSAQAYPRPGNQAVVWSISDPDGDRVVADFEVRHQDKSEWIKLASDTTDTLLQFSTQEWAEGFYASRITLKEQSPRPINDRFTVTTETDVFVVDHTAPEIVEAKVNMESDLLHISVIGRDKTSLLDGLELRFNNGFTTSWTQSDDGIRDSRSESFTAAIRTRDITGATSVEVILRDELGNATARRLQLP